MEISNLISYFKDCYQADTRTLSVTNIFASKVENRFFLNDRDELLNENLPYYPVPDDYADKVSKNLSIYKREKVFYCAAFFVNGKNENALSGAGKVCAPLFLYPAAIVEEGEIKYIKLDFEKRIININFLNSIKKASAGDLYDLLLKVPKTITDIGPLSQLRTILEDNLEDFNAEDILLYPALNSENKLKRLTQPKQLAANPGYSVTPSICFCVLRRSSTTLGIISELQSMALKSDYSSALSYLFDDTIKSKKLTGRSGKIPAILSNAQKDVIDSANQQLCTLVIGPPGTGKSFTIAALAVEQMSNGNSVLIASKTDQAVDVVLKKIENDLDIAGVALRAGKSDYRKKLKARLNYLLTTTRKAPKDKHSLFLLEKQLIEVSKSLDRQSLLFDKLVKNELRWGHYLAQYSNTAGLFARLKIRYIKWRNSLNEPHWAVNATFLQYSLQEVELLKEHIKLKFKLQVHHALFFSRRMFRSFEKSITARQSSVQDRLFEGINVPLLLESFPIWLSNMSDLNDVLPLEKEMFDVVIIDEASQCDIASCLPIIQRAKRIIIVGDPKQLRHTSFLSKSVQKSLQRKNNISQDNAATYLDYRNTSILDLVNDRVANQNQVCFLDEHFRSKPDIIQFSNRHFYNESLKIMTKMPVDDHVGSLKIIDTNGVRDKQGVNEKEANELIEYLENLIVEQQSLPVALCQSIGILSPFRDQTDHIAKEISTKLSIQAIERHSLTCGTAYSFQGEERDVMLLSLAIDKDSHHSALIHLNKPDVFNVSITRARARQVIFKSFPDQFDSGIYLRKYLSDIANFNQLKFDLQETEHDIFLHEVVDRLKKDAFKTLIEFSIAGLTVDVVFERKGQYYGINLIGYPGQYKDATTQEDHKTLIRAGLPTFPLPYTYWKFDAEGCYKELLSFSKSKKST
jgi:hypothetical protein